MVELNSWGVRHYEWLKASILACTSERTGLTLCGLRSSLSQRQRSINRMLGLVEYIDYHGASTRHWKGRFEESLHLVDIACCTVQMERSASWGTWRDKWFVLRHIIRGDSSSELFTHISIEATRKTVVSLALTWCYMKAKAGLSFLRCWLSSLDLMNAIILGIISSSDAWVFIKIAQVLWQAQVSVVDILRVKVIDPVHNIDYLLKGKQASLFKRCIGLVLLINQLLLYF